jgi:hypothetical protein
MSREPSPMADVAKHNDMIQFTFQQINKLEWLNPEPRLYLEKAVAKFGLPNVLAHQKGGCASWDTKLVKPLYKFEIKDEAVLSDTKGLLVNFCYAYVKYEVVPKCYEDVKNVNVCLNYDSQTKLLCARAKDYETCIALLMLGTAVGNCVVSSDLMKKKNRIEQAVELAYEKIDLFTQQLITNLKNATGTPIINERTEIPFYQDAI